MNKAQRALVVVALAGVAVAGPLYCLDYRAKSYWTTNGTLFDNALRPPDPVLTLSETEISPPTPTEAGIVQLTGLYARQGLAFEAALLGGLVGPIILLIAAGYMALAGNSHDAPLLASPSSGKEDVLSPPAVPQQNRSTEGSEPSSVPHRNLCRLAAIAGVIAPVLWVLDMPAVLLMMGARFPRWVFALLVIDAMRGFAH